MIRSTSRVFVVVHMALLAVCLFAFTGCAVLTTSQVREVKRFSEATDAYTELPGGLARSYGVLARNTSLLALSRKEFSASDTTNANRAWQEIGQAYETEQTLAAAAERMDRALAVLKIYSQILSQLVSDDYTNALGESSAKLSTSLNSAIDAYNKNKEPAANPLPAVGGNIAESIRLAGGLYIRHRQARILKDTIAEANPLIQALMGNVKIIAENQAQDFKAYESKLKTEFMQVADENRRLTVTTIAVVYDDLSRAYAGEALAKKVGEAATAYAAAHQALVDKTRERMDLKELIAEIQALRSEVKAAQEIKATMGK